MLNIDNSIVVAIDMQEKLINATNAYAESLNAEKMIEAANILNIPVIVTEQYPKGLGYTNDNIKLKLNSESVFIEKVSFSFLQEKNAVSMLKTFDKKQIILFGIETHICVLQSAIELLDNGYEVFLIRNACKSRNESEHQAGIDVLRQKGANIITLEIALFELLRTSKHPNFKEIQALIK